MEPQKKALEEVKIIGVTVRTSNMLEEDATTARIAHLWFRFFSDGLLRQIPDRKSPYTVLAAYTEYESDDRGEYSLVIGAEVLNLDHVPEGMVAVSVPASGYLMFRAEGKMPDVLRDTWKGIWDYFDKSQTHRRAYSTDLEIYDINRPGVVDILVAIS